MSESHPGSPCPSEPVVGSGSGRRILFLQGPTSPFWRELAIAFEAAGHATFKISVSLGDQLWWWRRGSVNYRGRFSRWAAFLDAFVRRHGITDILYYADRQPYHVVAQRVAARCGITAVSIENGYLRPDWITVELGGMGVYSHVPDDPRQIVALAAGLPEPDLALRYTHSFAYEMLNEVLYHGFSFVYRPLFPGFQSGRYYNLFSEYLHGLFKMRTARRARDHAGRVVEDLIATRAPFFTVALQLQSDKQIQSNSPFRHLGEVIEMTIRSFARHAPAGARLIFKQHPHDNGAERWDRAIARFAGETGVGERVALIDGGDLNLLLGLTRGCIVVNSTVGLYALRAGCPTIALGIAIYDLPGLTHQGGLDTFWTTPEPVDRSLVDAFVKVIAATVHVKGSFYHPGGRKAAAAEIVRRVAQDRVNQGLPRLPRPPRIARAAALGVPVDPPAET